MRIFKPKVVKFAHGNSELLFPPRRLQAEPLRLQGDSLGFLGEPVHTTRDSVFMSIGYTQLAIEVKSNEGCCRRGSGKDAGLLGRAA